MPVYKTQQLTYALALQEAMLAALSAVPGAALLTTPHVHLFTAGPTRILPTSVPTDFTEATFVGYAAVLLGTLLGPVTLDNEDGIALFSTPSFIAGAIVSPGQTILGYWVDNNTTTFYFGERFSTPIPVTNPLDYVTIDLNIPLLNPMSAV